MEMSIKDWPKKIICTILHYVSQGARVGIVVCQLRIVTIVTISHLSTYMEELR